MRRSRFTDTGGVSLRFHDPSDAFHRGVTLALVTGLLSGPLLLHLVPLLAQLVVGTISPPFGFS